MKREDEKMKKYLSTALCMVMIAASLTACDFNTNASVKEEETVVETKEEPQEVAPVEETKEEVKEEAPADTSDEQDKTEETSPDKEEAKEAEDIKPAPVLEIPSWLVGTWSYDGIYRQNDDRTYKIVLTFNADGTGHVKVDGHSGIWEEEFDADIDKLEVKEGNLNGKAVNYVQVYSGEYGDAFVYFIDTEELVENNSWPLKRQ